MHSHSATDCTVVEVDIVIRYSKCLLRGLFCFFAETLDEMLDPERCRRFLHMWVTHKINFIMFRELVGGETIFKIHGHGVFLSQEKVLVLLSDFSVL